MTAIDTLSELRRVRAQLTIIGDRLRCTAPRGALTNDLRAALSERKMELIALLSKGAFGNGSTTSAVISETAHLYPAPNRSVNTPRGMGRLWQVFSSRVGVVLACDPGRVAFFPPDQVQLLVALSDGGLANGGVAYTMPNADRLQSSLTEDSACCANQLTLRWE
jgi:TubC N-terminal docking domain